MSATEQDIATLLQSLLTTIETQIVPLTAQGVSSGSKLFGAAILCKSTLAPLTVATNNERASPLLHGEINCIQQFFSSPTLAVGYTPRPSTKDCIFVATHEPCSLCLSGITWSGFDNFYYLFTYEDSRDLFSIPYDIQILEEVFRVQAEGESEQALGRRELYNRKNKFFTAKSFADLVGEIEDEGERTRWAREVGRVKGLYGGLSERYQEGKREGVESASVWK
ncbi:cytidine deaminase-like protein [Pseudomassariella vexata]|uniref:Cytidine deaminase-like protein n=1 Tax=Pseudomassariella vexata TaxID=1141098 RepID=A0A1Y2DQP6_9PEZI|nr:cytidine deaminase-like protein [Pseudomassariella vexata]ORY61622.1 cytidine deaminase-like protein [Pseudomassariella vexata]